MRSFMSCALGVLTLILAVSPVRAQSRHVIVNQSHGEGTFSSPTEYVLPSGWGPAMDVLVGAGFSWSANNDPVTASALAGSCVVMVPEPLIAFSPEEVSAVLDYVAAGGGLLLANDFNAPINDISVPTGVRFRLDPSTGFVLVTDIVGGHPVTNGITTLDFPVGAPLELLDPSVVPLGYVAAEAVMAARQYGKGRILYVGDNELFAIYGIPDLDNAQLLRNVAEWLCREDTDNDGVEDEVDNCANEPNPDQADLDGDGIGDACDLDDDGDGVGDGADLCPQTPAPSVVGGDGCTCDQRLAVECPQGGSYNNHGAYVSCVSQVANQCVAEGLIRGEEMGEIVSAAARSDVGKK